MDLTLSATPQDVINGSGIINGIPREVKMSKFTNYKTENHPAIVVESSSMSGIELPELHYKNVLPNEIIATGQVSDIQTELINYAGQRHHLKLVNGDRAGFLNGDGTGVGKGRECTGLIYDSYLQGSRKALWISVSQDLMEDAKRDFNDIDFHIPLIRLNDYKIQHEIKLKEGVLFVTYSTLIQKKKDSNEISRLNQVIQWLQDDPNCIIVFDECHRLKNFFANGMSQPTQTGLAGVQLQRALPNAKVFYMSATGATDVRNLGYMDRLGLWGAGTSFPEGFSQFLMEVESGGIGAMEMVARDMKALGMYMSRNLSYEGVEYFESIHELTEDQTEMYNNVANLFLEILDQFEQAIEITGNSGTAKKIALQNFWSNNQRFWNQFITALKIPTAIKVIEEKLSEDKSIVISIINTLESRTSEKVAQVISEERDLEDVDFTPREVIVNLISKCFPTQEYEDTDSINGGTEKRPATDGEGNPIHSKIALEMKERLLRKVNDFYLPDNPLDQIINHFGHWKVAEITGRKRRLVKDEHTGKVEYKRRNPQGVSMNKVNIYEMDQFQSGKKRIAIISDAGACGISLHSDNGKLNTQKRVQLTLQIGWSADKQMQTFGRTHRTNQAHPPEYGLLVTNVGGEKRFASTIAKRLNSLGALTKGQADATGGDLAKYNFETKEGTAALQKFYKDIEDGRMTIAGINAYETLKDMRIIQMIYEKGAEREGIKKENYTNIPKFLNRILTIDLNRQNKMFNKFVEIFEALVDKAKESGTFDEGVTDLRAERIRLIESKILAEDIQTGAKTYYHRLEQDVKLEPMTIEKIMSIQQVCSKLDRLQGFYMNNRSRQICYIYENEPKTNVLDGKLIRRFIKQTPRSKESINLEEIQQNHTGVTTTAAGPKWIESFEKTPPFITQDVHIIAGVILPLWYKLKKGNTEGEDKLRIVRTTTDDGKRIVGIKIPNKLIKDVVINFNTTKSDVPNFTEVYSRIMQYEEKVQLAGFNNLIMRKVKMYGSSRIELANVKSNMFDTYEKIGLLSERYQGQTRFFFDYDFDTAERTYKQLLKIYLPQEHKKPEQKPNWMAELTKSRSAKIPDKTELVIDSLDIPIPKPRPDMPEISKIEVTLPKPTTDTKGRKKVSENYSLFE